MQEIISAVIFVAALFGAIEEPDPDRCRVEQRIKQDGLNRSGHGSLLKIRL